MLHTRRREQLLVAACLDGRQSFVVDNTNPLPSDRARYIASAHAVGFRVIAYCFKSTLDDANGAESPAYVETKHSRCTLAGTFKKLQTPTLEEGFDRVYIVELTAENRFLVT